MPEYISADSVREKISAGDTRSETAQHEITISHRDLATKERLAVRQQWAVDRKKWERYLDALEIGMPKE